MFALYFKPCSGKTAFLQTWFWILSLWEIRERLGQSWVSFSVCVFPESCYKMCGDVTLRSENANVVYFKVYV